MQEQILQKSFVPEKCWSIACSKDGILCATGGDSGNIHIWDASVGKLLLSWKAHHKRVTTIAFSDKGTEIVAGSEDSLVTVWSVARVLSQQSQQGSLHTWSDHTMPISQVCIGAGVTDPYVYVCSLDHTISVRSLLSGRLLQKVTLPSALTSIALDPLEYCAYVGSSSGNIFSVSFIEASSDVVQQSSTHTSSSNRITTFRTQCGGVTSLALSRDGATLVAGTEDGSVLTWDTVTGQHIRKSSIGASVATVLVLKYPLGMSGRGRGQVPESSLRMMPLGNFAKVAGSSGVPLKPWQQTMIRIDSSRSSSSSSAIHRIYEESTITSMMESHVPDMTHSMPGQEQDAQQKLQARIQELERENATLVEQKNRALSLLKKS